MTSVTSVTVKKPKKRTVNTVCKNCGTDVMHWIHYAAAGLPHDLILLLLVLSLPYFALNIEEFSPKTCFEIYIIFGRNCAKGSFAELWS